MTGAEFTALRKATGLSQKELGAWLGINERTIQRLEADEIVPDVYVYGVERAALKQALLQKNIAIVPATMRKDALDLAMLIRGD